MGRILFRKEGVMGIFERTKANNYVLRLAEDIQKI